MIGLIIMEVNEAEMRSALEYFNGDLFLKSEHKATVTKVRQRSSGRFVIEFRGKPEPKKPPCCRDH